MMMRNVEQARYNMAVQQIRPWNVFDDHVLEVIQNVPRERFVPHEYRNFAFTDMRIPLAHGEYMMEPKLEARMLQSLHIQPSDKVLEIGTGSGYVTACLARLGNQVVSYEIHEDLLEKARDTLSKQGINNVHLHRGNALEAAPASGEKFDVIAITGSMPEYDDRLETLLLPNGRLFVIVGHAPVMNAILIRNAKGCHQSYLFETEVAPLSGLPQIPGFNF